MTLAGILILALFLYIGFSLFRQCYQMYLIYNSGVSGLIPYPLIGNLFYFYKLLKRVESEVDIHPLALEIFEAHGKTFSFYLGTSPVIISTDIDFIQEIAIKQFSNFSSRIEYSFQNVFPMNESLLHIGKHGPRGYGWKEIRMIASQFFTSVKMHQIFPIVYERIQTLANVIEMSLGEDHVLDIYKDFQALSLDITVRTMLGIELDSLNNRDDEFYVNSRELLHELSFDRSWALALSFIFPELGKILRNVSNAGRIERKLTKRLEMIVKARKLEKNQNDEGLDLLNLLLKHKQNGENDLHEETVVSNCYGFLIAGYETTSAALAYSFWLLAKNPHVQETLYSEIFDHFGENQPIDYETILKMPYLNAVYLECLRLRPPSIFFMSRQCVNETVVQDYRIPAGVMIIIPAIGVNWSPDYWLDPVKFEPERFVNYEHNPLTWLPFGIGPRSCVGMKLAEIEMKTTLVELLRRFRFDVHEKSQSTLKFRVSSVVMQPKDGVLLKITTRN